MKNLIGGTEHAHRRPANIDRISGFPEHVVHLRSAAVDHTPVQIEVVGGTGAERPGVVQPHSGRQQAVRARAVSSPAKVRQNRGGAFDIRRAHEHVDIGHRAHAEILIVAKRQRRALEDQRREPGVVESPQYRKQAPYPKQIQLRCFEVGRSRILDVISFS